VSDAISEISHGHEEKDSETQMIAVHDSDDRSVWQVNGVELTTLCAHVLQTGVRLDDADEGNTVNAQLPQQPGSHNDRCCLGNIILCIISLEQLLED